MLGKACFIFNPPQYPKNTLPDRPLPTNPDTAVLSPGGYCSCGSRYPILQKIDPQRRNCTVLLRTIPVVYSFFLARGSVNQNVEPCPGTESTPISPPSLSTII